MFIYTQAYSQKQQQYTVSLRKNKDYYFCYNFDNFSPTRLKLYEMHSFSTSPNSCHHTNTDFNLS